MKEEWPLEMKKGEENRRRCANTCPVRARDTVPGASAGLTGLSTRPSVETLCVGSTPMADTTTHISPLEKTHRTHDVHRTSLLP